MDFEKSIYNLLFTIYYSGGYMRLILSFMVFALFGFVQQSCQKQETTTSKTEAAKANTNSTANSETATRRGAPAAAADTVAPPDEGAPRISLADAKKSFDAGEAVFVDTRAESAFKNERVKGAINIPAEAFQKRYTEVPKNKKIIAYCS